MKNNKKVYVAAFCGVAIAMNIVLGAITSGLGIPLYMDTLGTVLSAAILGPVPGVIVGLLTNVIDGLIRDLTNIPFALVNMAIGLIVGLIAKKRPLTLTTSILTGLLLSIVAPLIGTPIGIYVYGGLQGNAFDVIVTGLVKAGQSIFAASFVSKITSNLIDKIGTMVIAYFLIKAMPERFLDIFRSNTIEHDRA